MLVQLASVFEAGSFWLGICKKLYVGHRDTGYIILEIFCVRVNTL
jgi:hypothetical protein